MANCIGPDHQSKTNRHFRTRRTIVAFCFPALLILAILLGAGAAFGQNGCNPFCIFQAIEARQTPKDFSSLGVKPELNAALKTYQIEPSMKAAIGVLKFFTSDFYKMTVEQRDVLFKADPELFLSVDIAKYEIVMKVRKEVGAKSSRRVGSTGLREREIIEWVKALRPKDKMPGLDPGKQFVSDDDVTNLTKSADLLADEAVNGERAVRVFHDVTRSFGNEMGPDVIQTEFLSPTTAWVVFKARYGDQIAKEHPVPDFLYAWTAANPEKYNDPFGVYMLDVWGYDKGVVTEDVNDPMNTTKLFKEVYDAPEKPPASGKFAYIADNLRQAAVVHHGRFESQCKYLVRMIDAWIAIHGKESLPPDWKVNRAVAEAIYEKGVGLEGADQFRAHIEGIINEVVLTTHNYQLDRVANELRPALESLKNVPENKLTVADLEKYPQLVEELNGLLIAYTNVPESTHEMLMRQFQQRIQKSEASEATLEVFQSHVFKHIMEIVQNENQVQTEYIESFRRIRRSVEENLSKAIDGVDLAVFLEQVAKGQFDTTRLELEGLRVVRKKIQLSPNEVNQHLELIHALAKELGWSNEKYVEKVKDYFSGGPDKTLRAIQMLQGLNRFGDSTNATPARTSYVDRDGKTVEVEVAPSRKNLGLQLFVAAIRGGETAGTIVVKGGEWWGHVQNGKELFANLDRLFTQSGSMDNAAIGQTQAALFMNIINFNNLVNNWKVPAAGALTSNLVVTLSSNAGAVGIDPQANDELIYSAFKDLAVMYQPHLAGVIALIELGQWGYKEWSLSGEKNDIIDAMVENGVWEPGDVKGVKNLKLGELPKLKAVRNNEGGQQITPAGLARRDMGNITLIESKKEFNPWLKMLEIAHDGSYLDSDTIITSSVDAINELSGSYWWRKFHLGVLPPDKRKWNKPTMEEIGIIIKRAEDDSSTPLDANQILIDTTKEEFPASETQLRLIGYLMADYWIKRQKILEKGLLPGLEKEAARRFLDKLKEAEAEASTYNFTEQVEEIYKEVKLVDKKLWPRVAHSANPFPISNVYDPEKNTPILDAFKDENRVKNYVVELQQLQGFLRDPDKTRIQIFDYATSSEMQLNRAGGASKGKELLKGLRDYYRKLLDGYDQVHDVLDQGNRLLKEGNLTVEPFHIKFEPDSWALWALSEGPTNPVRGDLKTAKSWLDDYNKARKRVFRDVAAKTKGTPSSGPLEDLWNFVQTALDHDTVETAGSPAHPLWPKLVRLRYQIHTLELMESFAVSMEGTELRDYVSKMTMKDGQAPNPTDDDLSDSSKRLAFIAKTKQQMEDEYNRLLDSLTHLFDIALALDTIKPYIGQEVSVIAAIKRNTEQIAGTTNSSTGFPDYVSRFRWKLEDIEGSQVGATVETTEPKWNPKAIRSGLYRVRCDVLDKGGNAIAKASFDGPDVQRLLVWGSINIADGDYNNQPFALKGTRWQGEAAKPGPFSIELKEFDADAWDNPSNKIQAEVVVDGRTYYSTMSEVEVDPRTGLLKLKEDLNVTLPYDVALKVTVIDQANQPVSGADATILGPAGPVKGTSAAMKLAKGDQINANVSYPPLELTWLTPIVRFDPQQGRSIELKAELPMFDTGHLVAFGQFVPDTLLSPAPQLNGGQVSSNIGSVGIENQGVFTLTNDKPINLQSNPQFEAIASVTDANGKHYLPKAGKITKGIGNDSRLDLGRIEVARLGLALKPIQVQLFDWTGRAITPGAGQYQVFINGVAAVNNGGTFVGEYTFTDDSENIIIEGDFSMPDGSQCVWQQHIAARDFGGIGAPSPQSPPRYSLKLPFYLPGSLHISGRTRIDGVPKDRSAPGFVNLADSSHGLNNSPVSNGPFDFTFPLPVYLNENLTLQAAAKDGDITYQGSITTKAPGGDASLDVGEIILTGSGGDTARNIGNEEPPEPVTNAGAKPPKDEDAPEPVGGKNKPAKNEAPEPVASPNQAPGSEPPEDIPESVTGNEINFIDHQYVPGEATLKDGNTIRICNRDRIYHSPFSSNRYNKFTGPQLAPSKCMSLTIHNPTSETIRVGLFDEIHSQERLTLTVLPSESSSASEAQTASTNNTNEAKPEQEKPSNVVSIAGTWKESNYGIIYVVTQTGNNAHCVVDFPFGEMVHQEFNGTVEGSIWHVTMVESRPSRPAPITVHYDARIDIFVNGPAEISWWNNDTWKRIN